MARSITRTLWLWLALLVAAPAYAQEAPQSDRQLRQRAGYGIARVDAAIEDLEALREHFVRLRDAIHARITADSLAAIDPTPELPGEPVEPDPPQDPEPVALDAECSSPRAAWIFCDDFEQDRSAFYFERDTQGGSFARVAGVGVNGTSAMRASFAAGQVNAGSLKLAFGRTPDAYMRPADDGVADHREVYWRFYLRSDADWAGGGGDKLSRAVVFAAPSWAEAAIGHVWSDGNVLAVDPASGTDPSGALRTTKYNDFANLRWLGKVSGTAPVFSATGQWRCVESRMRLNDAGSSNGVLELWIDGAPEARADGLNFVGAFGDYGINALFIENYWGNGSPRAQSRYIDNLVVSTARIGCGEVTQPEIPSEPEPEEPAEPEVPAEPEQPEQPEIPEPSVRPVIEDRFDYPSTSALLSSSLLEQWETVQSGGSISLDAGRMRFDWRASSAPARGGSIGVVYPLANTAEVWVEFDAALSPGFSISNGYTGGAALKFFGLRYRNPPVGRIGVGFEGSQLTFAGPDDVLDASHVRTGLRLSDMADGRMRHYRLHAKLDGAQVVELWVDGQHFRSPTGWRSAARTIYGVWLGKNINMAPLSPQWQLWDNVRVYTQDPGW